MSVLARPGKASVPTPTDTTSDAPSASRAAQEQITPAAVRAQTGPSLIGAGLSVGGRLSCAGDLQIEGSVEGEVRAQGVRLGSGAVVKGTITGEVVQVAGTLEGNIEAESVIVARTARITGDISYRSLQIDEGADFSGTCKPRRKAALPPRVDGLESVPQGSHAAPGNSYGAPVPERVN